MIAALVAGDIVATEDGNGTLKTILTRSVDRGQVFAAKALAAVTYAATPSSCRPLVATVAGVASWGFNEHHHLLRHGRLRRRSAAAGVRLQRVLPDPAADRRQHRRAALDRSRATAPRRSSAPSASCILLLIVAQIPGLEGIKPYLLTEQFESWHGLLRTPTDWAPIGHSAWVCALYAVPSLFAGYLVFLRRDVAGG